MNFLNAATRLRRDASKMARGLKLINPTLSDNDAYEQALDSHMDTIREDMRIGCRLMMMFKEVATEEGLTMNQQYFISVRPDTSKICFEAFYALTKKFIERKCFNSFQLVFEQKGTTEDNLGDGFHVHIIAKMRQRSKGEVLRDTQSTYKDCCAHNCIQVDCIRTPQDMERVKAYLTDHASQDGHKELTQAWDEMWRTKLGMQHMYEGELPQLRLGLSSPAGPTIIELS